MDLSNKKLRELPDLSIYVNLVKLDCSLNNLKCINKCNLPPYLKELICYGNNLTELDDLSPGLEILNCSQNNIIQLDNIPYSIVK